MPHLKKKIYIYAHNTNFDTFSMSMVDTHTIIIEETLKCLSAKASAHVWRHYRVKTGVSVPVHQARTPSQDAFLQCVSIYPCHLQSSQNIFVFCKQSRNLPNLCSVWNFINAYANHLSLHILAFTETWIKPEKNATPTATNYASSHTWEQYGAFNIQQMEIHSTVPSVTYDFFEYHACHLGNSCS